MIVCDERNDRARAIRADLTERLPKDWAPPEGIVIVIGGDGFLLKTVKAHGLGQAYLGLNAGHLGFLLNDVRDRDELASFLEDGSWTVHRFPLLEARIEAADGEHTVATAINDVYLERSTGQAARLTITIDGHRLVESMVADGVVFATALGSTAYAYSAGGQPLHPSLDLIQVAPICPHLPRLTPFVLPASAQAEVEVEHHSWRPVRAVADGRAVEDVTRVTVAMSDERVQLAYLDTHDFTAQMLHKIVRP